MAREDTDGAQEDLEQTLVILANEESEEQGDENTEERPDEDEGPMPVEPDGGTGDGAAPPGESDGNDDEGPMPVEPDGGIGDGAGPPSEGNADGPMPVEPDGGIGDGAGPPSEGDEDGPMPVEPDGGIGDGAGPPGDDGPFPVEPDGGIGDGAGPPPEAEPIAVLFAGQSETPERLAATDDAEVFAFVDGGNVAIYDFDPETDYLDFTQMDQGFSSLDELLAASWNFTNIVSGEQTGILIALGDGQLAYIDGLAVEDLSNISVDF